MPAAPVSRPWRRYLRFSMRGLIVLLVVIGVALGWLVRGARNQREAVAAIRKTGGLVSYDWESKNGKWVRNGRPWAPKWLVDALGVDYFVARRKCPLLHAWRGFRSRAGEDRAP